MENKGLERRGWDSNPRYGYPYNGFRVLDFPAGPCRAVTKRAFLLAISVPIILASDGWYRNVSHGWFAIWFANSLRAMSAFEGKADIPGPLLMSANDPKRTGQAQGPDAPNAGPGPR